MTRSSSGCPTTDVTWLENGGTAFARPIAVGLRGHDCDRATENGKRRETHNHEQLGAHTSSPDCLDILVADRNALTKCYNPNPAPLTALRRLRNVTGHPPRFIAVLRIASRRS